jgi:hypothetical protein
MNKCNNQKRIRNVFGEFQIEQCNFFFLPTYADIFINIDKFYKYANYNSPFKKIDDQYVYLNELILGEYTEIIKVSNRKFPKRYTKRYPYARLPIKNLGVKLVIKDDRWYMLRFIFGNIIAIELVEDSKNSTLIRDYILTDYYMQYAKKYPDQIKLETV